MSTQGSLADRITGILNSAPKSFDPEDDDVDNTCAQTVSFLEDVDKSDNESNQTQEISKKRPFNYLMDTDERYSGKKKSRKSLRESDGEDSYEDEEGSISGNSKSDSEKASSEADSEFEGSDPEESDEENDDYDDDNESHDFGVENDSFKHINTANISIEKKKGLCVKNQINLWENLLEMRIQLQKCLLVSNKMPQHDTYKQLTSTGDEAFTSKLNETQKTVRDLLEKFLTLQSLLFKQYPETKSLLTQNGNGVSKERDEGIESDSNEEIPSDSDEETTNDCKDDKPDEETVFKSKRRKLSDYEAHLKDAHSKYKTYRDSTIQKWNDKTKVLSKSNDVTSVLKQIEYVLNDKEKLLQRTRQKKSNFEVLGKSIANAEGDNLEQQTDANEYDPEIFDDSDFYHQILRELIEFRSADLTDPVQLGRQWVQLQSMRSKMKRSIDTRATKGRKIRYAVHSKLVNFMAPMDDSKWTDAAKTDLYSSLFRGNQNIGVTSV